MLENSNNTPQQKLTPADEERLVLESIFGNSSDDAFDEDAGWEASDTPEEQPQGLPQEEAIAPEPQADNDAVRYQYWQSEAQKKETEMARMRAEMEYYKKMAELQAAQSQPQPVAEEPAPERFPDPPMRPEPPLGYSYEEALSNPQSPSAQYAMNFQQWQQDMFEYNNLKSEYLEAVMQEKFEALENRERAARQQYEQQQAYHQQIQGIRGEVMSKYGVDEKTADDFIQKMNDPQNLNIDNLFALYKAVYGGAAGAQKPPTPEFNQSKVANQFGPAYNQLPTGVSTVGKKPDDQIFDSILQMEKKRSEW